MPQPAMNAPPPPPPALLRETPNGNSPMNAALAREAMLEAIRSGDAADKLKKVKCAPVWTNDLYFSDGNYSSQMEKDIKVLGKQRHRSYVRPSGIRYLNHRIYKQSRKT